MEVVDASVLVAWFHRADRFHQASRDWLRAHLRSGRTLVAPLLLLAEVAGALTRQTGDPALGYEALRWMRALPELSILPIDDALGQLAGELAVELRLRGADATYVALADALQLPIRSWDREIIERGGLRVTALRPDESIV